MPESRVESKQRAQISVNTVKVGSCFVLLVAGSPFPIEPVQAGSSVEAHHKGYQQRILFPPLDDNRKKWGVQVFQGLEHQ